MIQSAKKIKNVKQKIVIIGGGHARNSAAELQHSLGSTFSVSSSVKPGAEMKVIVDTVKEDIGKLNPLNAELNPICHLLPLLGGATIVVVSRLRVKSDDVIVVREG